MSIVLALVLVVALAIFVLAPLYRRTVAEADSAAGEAADRADLEARKESLYRQIRDAELDREQGKLSQADWARVDAELRRDAIAVLKMIDRASSVRDGGSLISRLTPVESVLEVVQILISVVLIFLVLLHSGKDAGLSGAFGIGATGGSVGGSLVERNLDRWTIFFGSCSSSTRSSCSRSDLPGADACDRRRVARGSDRVGLRRRRRPPGRRSDRADGFRRIALGARRAADHARSALRPHQCRPPRRQTAPRAACRDAERTVRRGAVQQWPSPVDPAVAEQRGLAGAIARRRALRRRRPIRCRGRARECPALAVHAPGSGRRRRVSCGRA